MGFLASSGHSTTFTRALSPVLPPFSLSLGIKDFLINSSSYVQHENINLLNIPIVFYSIGGGTIGGGTGGGGTIGGGTIGGGTIDLN